MNEDYKKYIDIVSEISAANIKTRSRQNRRERLMRFIIAFGKFFAWLAGIGIAFIAFYQFFQNK